MKDKESKGAGIQEAPVWPPPRFRWQGVGEVQQAFRPIRLARTRRYDVPLIRLKDCQSQLDTDDLDEDEKRALAEVSKQLASIGHGVTQMSKKRKREDGQSNFHEVISP